MASNNTYRNIIQNELKKLKKPVNIKVFTSLKTNPDGTQVRKCIDCDQTMQMLRIYEENSNNLLNIEELSIYDNQQFAEQFDIQRIPTILLMDAQNREVIRYLANPQGQEIQPFVSAIFALGGGPNYYENAIKQNIERIGPTTIKIMMTQQCPYCPELIKTANLYAIASDGKIRTVVVDIMANPDIGQYYKASGVPYTILNERPAIQGMIGPQQLLRELIGSNINIRY
jgi:alkyl hydroperoxide reductase subunit AhpF